VGVLLGYLADLVLGDPRAGHPVAGFGAAASALERVTYRDSRAAGAVYVAVLVGAVSLVGVAVERQARRCGAFGSVVVTAMATWVALGGTSLTGVGSAMGELLSNDDLVGARRLLPVHWGTFDLSDEAVDEPPRELERQLTLPENRDLRDTVRVLPNGGSFEL